jgi:hypothetical protein
MPAAVEPSISPHKINPRFLPAIDRVLITGLRLGPAGKHQAINKVLQLVPEWKRGDCWRRIRQLRRNSETPKLQLCPPRSGPEALEKSASGSRPASRPWTPEEDARLLDWAGYEPVNKIAQRLNRSVRAVRFRLGALGMSAKVSDGWSQRALRKLLRVSPAKLRFFIGSGMLRVRDPRIATTSMLRLCCNNRFSLDRSAMERNPESISKQNACSWERAADVLGITVRQVQSFICKGKLKVLDPFVTDRSFEEFCRKHGDRINLTLIDPATAKWLIEEYGVPENGILGTVSRAQKHALVIRTCRCGRKVAGNIFFKHVRHCRVLNQPTIGAAG